MLNSLLTGSVRRPTAPVPTATRPFLIGRFLIGRAPWNG